MPSKMRELALFNLAIDSKLRACDLTWLLARDVQQGIVSLGSTAVDSHLGTGNSFTMSNRRPFGGIRRSNSVRVRRPLSVRSHFRTNGLPQLTGDLAIVLALLLPVPHVREKRV